MTDTQSLLAEYVRTGSDAAFRELVTRYVDLVYSTALRLVDGDTHRAEDVAQTVFVDLARQARTLSPDAMLGGWLHRHTCFVAANMKRSERRRQFREKAAMQMNVLHNDSGTDFSLIAPILDESIDQLNEDDRTAILLRFFEQRDFRSVGNALGSNEDAARMRVTRALEKLHLLLKRRGITAGTAALVLALSANAVQSAPVGLAAAISTAAIVTGTTASTSTVAIATKTIAMTALQKTIIGAVIVTAVGTGIFEAHQASQLREQNQTLQEQQTSLAGQVRQLRREHDDATNQLADLLAENERLQLGQNEDELLKLRAQITRLQARLTAGTSASSASIPTNNSEAKMRQQGIQIAREANLVLAVEGRLLVLKKHLRLAPDQVEAARKILRKKYGKDDFLQAKIPDPDLMALLTPDQQSLLEQLTKERLRKTIRDQSEEDAQGDLFTLEAYLGLNQQQYDMAFPVLSKFYQKIFEQHSEQPGTIVFNLTLKQQKKLGDQKINLFKNILTADQFAIYKRYEKLTMKAEELCPPRQ